MADNFGVLAGESCVEFPNSRLQILEFLLAIFRVAENLGILAGDF